LDRDIILSDEKVHLNLNRPCWLFNSLESSYVCPFSLRGLV